MKQTVRLICLALFCAGAVWVEFQMVLRFGSGLVLFVVASALAVLFGALVRAPEGHERADGFHVRARDQSRLSRSVRLSEQRMRREWT
jgi:hypothetical protein